MRLYYIIISQIKSIDQVDLWGYRGMWILFFRFCVVRPQHRKNGCALFRLCRNALCALNSAGASLYAMKENGGMVAEFTDQGITLYNDINYAVK